MYIHTRRKATQSWWVSEERSRCLPHCMQYAYLSLSLSLSLEGLVICCLSLKPRNPKPEN